MHLLLSYDFNQALESHRAFLRNTFVPVVVQICKPQIRTSLPNQFRLFWRVYRCPSARIRASTSFMISGNDLVPTPLSSPSTSLLFKE